MSVKDAKRIHKLERKRKQNIKHSTSKRAKITYSSYIMRYNPFKKNYTMVRHLS